MKTTVLFLFVLTGSLFVTRVAVAQGYGSTNRFGDPRSRYGPRPLPAMPAQPTPAVRPIQAPLPAAPPQVAPSDAVRFSSLAPDTAFFFLADTNRSFLWMKISPTTASNTVNQKVATIPAAVLVKAQATAVERPPRIAPTPAAEPPAPAPAAAEPPARPRR